MKALLLTEPRQLEMADLPRPKVGPRDVLVEVRACGICGSDVHGYDGSSGRRIPPLVMGHEAAGVVAEVGRDVTSVRPGERVTFDSTIWCGTCAYCRRGQVNLCDRRQVLGVSCGEYRRDGAFAEYVVVPEWIVYPLPPSIPFAHAALIEAVSVAVHAAARTPVQIGDCAVVVGAGMIGLLTLQAVQLKGCSRCVAVDLDPAKLAMAKTLGATDVIQAGGETDVAEAVRSITDGHGADVVLEAVGVPASVQTAASVVRKGGHVTLIGNVAPSVPFSLQTVVTREITIAGSCASSGEYPVCIDLLARGRIQVEPLISAHAPLEEGPAWFDKLYQGTPGVFKVVLAPKEA